MGRGRHANPAVGAFGGAPYGATKRCAGWCVTHAGSPTGAFGGATGGRAWGGARAADVGGARRGLFLRFLEAPGRGPPPPAPVCPEVEVMGSSALRLSS